ncbi:hypothetical protein BH09ACT7_BH09ACT7_41180 [soil metagenome]
MRWERLAHLGATSFRRITDRLGSPEPLTRRLNEFWSCAPNTADITNPKNSWETRTHEPG